MAYTLREIIEDENESSLAHEPRDAYEVTVYNPANHPGEVEEIAKAIDSIGRSSTLETRFNAFYKTFRKHYRGKIVISKKDEGWGEMPGFDITEKRRLELFGLGEKYENGMYHYLFAEEDVLNYAMVGYFAQQCLNSLKEGTKVGDLIESTKDETKRRDNIYETLCHLQGNLLAFYIQGTREWEIREKCKAKRKAQGRQE